MWSKCIVQATTLLLGYADCVLVNAHIWQGLLSSRTSCCELHNSKHSKKAYRMENLRCHILLLVFALVAAVNSQSYPRFEIRGDVLVNNSFILRPNIGEGHNDWGLASETMVKAQNASSIVG